MRRRRWWIALAAVLATIVVALVVLPGLVRWRLESRIAALTGRTTTIEDVDLNLFTRRLVVHDLRVLGEPGEPALASLERLGLRFHLLAFVVRGAYVLDTAEVVRPVVRVVRTHDDRLNVSALVEQLTGPDAGPPLELRIAGARIADGWIGFEDRVVSPPVAWAVEGLNAELTSVSTDPEDLPGSVTAGFTVAGEPGSVRATDVRLGPVQGRALVALRELPIHDAWTYVPDDAAIRPVGGRLTVRAEVRIDPRTGVHLDSDGTLVDLVLRRRGQTEAWLVSPALALVSRDVVYRDGGARVGRIEVSGDATLVEAAVSPPQRVPLDNTRVTLTGAAVPGPAPGHVTAEADLPDGGRLEARGALDVWPFTTRLEVTLAGAPLHLAAPHVPADAPVQLDGGRLDADLVLALTPAGVALDGDLTARDVIVRRQSQKEPFFTAPALRATIEGLAVRDGTVTLDRLVARGAPTIVDATAAAPQRYEVTSARLILARVAHPAGPPARVAFEASLGDGARVRADGTASLDPLATRLAVTTGDVPLTRINAYLSPPALVTVGRGLLGGTLQVRYTTRGGLGVDAELQARDIAVHRRGQADPLVTDHHVDVAITGFVMDDDGLALRRVEVEGTPAVVDTTATPTQRYATRRARAVVEGLTWPPRAPARVSVEAESELGAWSSAAGHVDLATLATRARVEVRGLRLERVDAYLPSGAPVRLGRGELTATVDFTHDQDAQRMTGGGRVADLAVALRDQPAPFLVAPDVGFTVDDLVVHDGRVQFRRATVESAPTMVALEGFGVDGGQIVLERSTAVAEDLVLPDGGTAPVQLDAVLPGGGRLTARGGVEPATRRLEVGVDAAIGVAALDGLVPVDGTLQGRLQTNVRVAATFDRAPEVAVTGDAAVHDVALADGDRVLAGARRVSVTALDLQWPTAIAIAELKIEAPSVLVERAEDGSFPLHAMLADRAPDIEAVAASPRTEPAAGRQPTEAASKARLRLELGRLALEEGELRFLDRTVTPAYGEEISRLSVTATGLTTDENRAADIAVQGIVGGSAALELSGEVAPFGEPFYLDVTGTLRDFPAPRTNPYVQHHTAWAIERGDVRTDVHYRIVGNELEATNSLVVEQLAVTQMEPDARVEIPLGLIVSLLKDRQGDIRLTVPVRGQLNSPEFDFGRAFGQAFKNVVTRLVTAPLSAIGRLFRSPDDGAVAAVAIDPVPFEPGGAVLTPEAERHLHQVADVLRSSPFVKLRLAASVTDEDVAVLATQNVVARIQRLQRGRGLTFEDAATAVFAQALPGRPVPESAEAIVTALRETLPRPDEAAVRALGDRRLAVTRQALSEQAGVAPERLALASQPVRLGAAGTPRVDLDLDSS